MSNDFSDLMNAHQTASGPKTESKKKTHVPSDQNKYLADPELGLELCASLIENGNQKNRADTLVSELDELVQEKFLEHTENSDNTYAAQTYADLNRLLLHVSEVVSFPFFEKACTVAVGGSFSAGKSRFLNSVLGCPSLLPTDTTPTTSIPTYISKSDHDAIYALNFYKKKTEIDEEALKAICHEFSKRFNVTFSHLLQLISVERESFTYPNLIFLDTPGYSKADSLAQDKHATDANIAKEHLACADYLIWLIDIQNGTIPQQDIEFIYDLNMDKPILCVLSKADKKTEKEIQSVIETAKQSLEDNDIEYIDVVGYSSAEHKEYSESASVISSFMQDVSDKGHSTTLYWLAKKIFADYLSYFESDKQSLKLTQGLINELIFEEGVSEEKKQHLTDFKNKIKGQLDELTQAKMEATKVQEAFIERITELCELLGLDISSEPQKHSINSLKKKSHKSKIQKDHRFDALIEGDISTLSSMADVENIPGTIEKASAVGVKISLDGNDSIRALILKQKLNKVLSQTEIEQNLCEGTAVTLQILDNKKCVVKVSIEH